MKRDALRAFRLRRDGSDRRRMVNWDEGRLHYAVHCFEGEGSSRAGPGWSVERKSSAAACGVVAFVLYPVPLHQPGLRVQARAAQQRSGKNQVRPRAICPRPFPPRPPPSPIRKSPTWRQPLPDTLPSYSGHDPLLSKRRSWLVRPMGERRVGPGRSAALVCFGAGGIIWRFREMGWANQRGGVVGMSREEGMSVRGLGRREVRRGGRDWDPTISRVGWNGAGSRQLPRSLQP